MTKKSYTLDDNGGRGASLPPLRVKELPFPMNNVKTEAENEAITGAIVETSYAAAKITDGLLELME